MSYVMAKDISQYQGAWVDTGEEIVLIKMSGGDAGLYYDTQATTNYYGAKAAGKAVGGYHFAGGADPVAEANFFVRAMSPLEEDDVLALDWEVQHPNPVAWCLTFVMIVHDKTGVWPMLYINLSTLNTYDWTPVLANCGLWLADWGITPEENARTPHAYVMHQYADGPGYDRDAWFGTVEQFKAYGYHATPSLPPVEPSTVPTLPTINTVGTVESSSGGVQTTTVTMPSIPEVPVSSAPVFVPLQKKSWLVRFLDLLTRLFRR